MAIDGPEIRYGPNIRFELKHIFLAIESKWQLVVDGWTIVVQLMQFFISFRCGFEFRMQNTI